jgi:antitoxin component YwqK of YwqJK toxin-antitoxin module
MKTKQIEIFILALNFIVFFSQGQQMPVDSGFTKWTEAANLTVNNLREGKWFEYMDSNNKRTFDTNAPYYVLLDFKEGKPSGIARQYYRKSKKLYSIALYIAGVENGVTKLYYENGNLMFEYPFTNGNQEGLVKGYYESGKLKGEYPYARDKLNGTQKEYYESGELKSETPYIYGNRNGLEKDYFKSGKLQGEYPFKNDAEDGIEKQYYENGKLKSTTSYKKGEEGETKNWDENGVEIHYMQENPLEGHIH